MRLLPGAALLNRHREAVAERPVPAAPRAVAVQDKIRLSDRFAVCGLDTAGPVTFAKRNPDDPEMGISER